MSRKRLTAWVLVLTVVVTVRITIAAPRGAMAELRAAVCCVEHCPRPARIPMAPHRCCFVGSGESDPASLGAAASLERPAAPAVALVPARLPVVPSTGHVRADALPALRAGPPGFVDTVQLRC